MATIAYEVAESAEEAAEMEHASNLLEVTEVEGLDQVLRQVIATAPGAGRAFASSPAGRSLHRLLRQAARRAAPLTGGTQVGASLVDQAGPLLAMELEGESPEEEELEAARRFVQFATAAATRAASPAGTDDRATPATAALAAARRYVPGLVPWLGGVAGLAGPGGSSTGGWTRSGSHIVILGA